MREGQFGLRPRHSTSFHLARLVQRITGNFGVNRLTGKVFLDVAKSLRYRLDRRPPLQAYAPNLPALHSPCNLIMPMGSHVQRVLPDGHLISSRHAGWGDSGWTYLPCPLQFVRRHIRPPSHHGELALYADDTAILATSRKTTLLVSYLESYLNDLQRLVNGESSLMYLRAPR
jgi:hypothetical protein